MYSDSRDEKNLETKYGTICCSRSGVKVHLFSMRMKLEKPGVGVCFQNYKFAILVKTVFMETKNLQHCCQNLQFRFKICNINFLQPCCQIKKLI